MKVVLPPVASLGLTKTVLSISPKSPGNVGLLLLSLYFDLNRSLSDNDYSGHQHCYAQDHPEDYPGEAPAFPWGGAGALIAAVGDAIAIGIDVVIVSGADIQRITDAEYVQPS